MEDGEQIFALKGAVSSARENPFIDWLLREAWEAASSRELTRRLVQCLGQGGVPIGCLRITIPTLHPLLATTNCSWSEKDPEVGRFEIFHELAQIDTFQDSPPRRIFDGMAGVRRWIGAESEDDFWSLLIYGRKG